MERRVYDTNPDETYVERQVAVNDVIKREDDHNKARKSRRRQLIEIQKALGWETHPVEVGNLLKLTEQQTRRYLSRRGIRNAEFEEIQEVLTGYHTIALMLIRIHPGPHAFVDRRALLAHTNDFLLERTGVDAIKTGKPDMIIAELEATHMFHEVVHPE
jgi:hypothetical protein